MTPLPKDSPLMRKWEGYVSTEVYRNAFRWAAHEEHRQGSMWAAFMAGFSAAKPEEKERSALVEIGAEIDRATDKFPTWPTDALHAVGVVAEEMGELQKEVMQLTYEPHKSTKESVRKEAVQLAAMALRFLMSLDRYEYEPRPQHCQETPKPEEET